MRPRPLRRWTVLFACIAFVVLAAVPANASESATAGAPPSSPNISITQTPGAPSWFCLPGFLALQHTVSSTPTTFTLTVRAWTRPCSPIRAHAVIYAMPPGGGAWPQTLAEKSSFTISNTGTTTVVFSKHCEPVQFDVVTGATPPQISPFGAWHGPLLFPFDINTSQQYFPGPECNPTTTTTTTTLPGGPCDDYTPTQVAVDPTTVAPGGTVTVTGVAVPGDTVTATLDPPGSVLGSDVADPSGQFSITGIVPANTPAGVSTITVSSEQCPTSTTVSLTIEGAVNSSCRENRAGRTFEQGDTVNWGLKVPSFSTSDPVTLQIKKGGVTTVLYTGPWPGSDTVTVSIPATAAPGRYKMQQVGTRANGNGTRTRTCPIWVGTNTSNVAATSPGSGESGVPPQAAVALGALMVGGYSLVRLSGRRARSSTTHAS